MCQFSAHIRLPSADGIPERRQSVEAHCRTSAQYAAQVLAPLGLSQTGRLLGLVHDAGKYTAAFQDYLERAVRGEKVQRGSVNHTFAGVRLLLERYHRNSNSEDQRRSCELLAAAVGSHHGWFDCVDEQAKNGFEYRLHKPDIGYAEASQNFFRFCVSQQALDEQFTAAVQELQPVWDRVFRMTGDDADDERYAQETAFYAGMLARLLLSAVMEGDRRDTAEFMNDAKFPPQRNEAEQKQLWTDCLRRVETKLDAFPQKTPIDCARRAISDRCRAFGAVSGGILRLNVPTGGGKTLSSLRFALCHAAAHGKRRIIFTAPLLSILDQNAGVIRDFVGDDSIILEHHSNLPMTEQERYALGLRGPLTDAEQDQLDARELLTETWDAPIVITTLVQLLNTLFAGKTSAIRRLHALCDSILVIDEVQTVPSSLLSLFSLAMNFLAEICGATVVLCSATQPCMERIPHPLHTPIPDMVPYDPALWEAFRRTEIQDGGSRSLDEIADLATSILEEADSLLIVCNKKDEAETLFRSLRERAASCCHLSAAMCMAHRKQVLEGLKAALAKRDGTKILCVSTQVIEAGVDISFARVLRLSAGMDSVVQAAGRCNRSGEAGAGVLSPVLLVQCQGETLGRLPDIQAGQHATNALLAEFRQRPQAFQGTLDSDAAISYYYRALYKDMKRYHQDDTFPQKPYTLLSLLAQNEALATGKTPEEANYMFHQAFRLAGSLFEVFGQETTDVIVPYGAGKTCIEMLCSDRARWDFDFVRLQLAKAKPYTVSLYRYQVEALRQAIIPLCGGALALTGHYDNALGFTMQEQPLDFLMR